jgi:hypothetical protein
MKLKNLSLKEITIIQILIAILISLMFQFLIPYSWQPLHLFTYGINAEHGDPEANLVIFTVSQWYFSFSVAWFLYRKNKYINNFLVYSVAPLSTIIVPEFIVYFLFIDYIHLLPFLVGIYIFWKKRDTVVVKYFFPNFCLASVWLFIVYFFKLAYFQATFLDFFINWLLIALLSFLFFFFIRLAKNREKEKYEKRKY